MLRIVVAIVLAAHGIGHVMGPLGLTKVAVANPAWQGDSWLLAGAGPLLTQAVGWVVWAASIVAFLALAAVVMGWLPAAWWPGLAVGGSIVSLLGIVLFPAAFPLGSTVGAVVVDVIVLAAVLVAHWSPADLTA